MAGSWPEGFGGLCANGHDVPPGASCCPSCGAPSYAPTDAPPYDAGPAGFPPPAPAPIWDPANDPGSPWAHPGWRPPPPGAAANPGPWAPPGGPWAPPGGPWNFPQPGYWYAPPARSTNGLAIASMVLGILWIYWVGSILAVIFGHIALRQVRDRGQQGRGMAIAGLVLGYVGVTTAVALIIGLAVVGTN